MITLLEILPCHSRTDNVEGWDEIIVKTYTANCISLNNNYICIYNNYIITMYIYISISIYYFNKNKICMHLPYFPAQLLT